MHLILTFRLICALLHMAQTAQRIGPCIKKMMFNVVNLIYICISFSAHNFYPKNPMSEMEVASLHTLLTLFVSTAFTAHTVAYMPT